MRIHTWLHRDYLLMCVYMCVCMCVCILNACWTTHHSVDRFATTVTLEPPPVSLSHDTFDNPCLPVPLHSSCPLNLRHGKKFLTLKTPVFKHASVPTCEWAPEASTTVKEELVNTVHHTQSDPSQPEIPDSKPFPIPSQTVLARSPLAIMGC